MPRTTITDPLQPCLSPRSLSRRLLSEAGQIVVRDTRRFGRVLLSVEGHGCLPEIGRSGRNPVLL